MIEYITQTGIFGIFWIISFVFFIGSLINFIKRNGLKTTLSLIVPILILFLFFNHLVKELIGKSDFDLILIFIKDFWFLSGHIFISNVLIFEDKDCIEFWKIFKKMESEE